MAYQSRSGIAGQYLVCILFPSYLVLAKSESDSRKLTLISSIFLSDMTVDSSMNGQGRSAVSCNLHISSNTARTCLLGYTIFMESYLRVQSETLRTYL